MKILYVTDVHASFDMLKIVTEHAEKTKPDLIQVSGDLIDFALLKKANSQMLAPISNRYHPQTHQALFQILAMYAQQYEPGLKRLTPYELPRAIPIIAEKIYKNLPDKNLDALITKLGLGEETDSQTLVEDYLNILDFAEGNMDIQYDLLKTMLDKTGIDYHVIPGNYDKDLQLSSLKEHDIHKKNLEKNGITIAGFGGANNFQHGDILPPGIPKELTVPFNEYPDRQGRTMSEIFNFLIKEKPDIAFTHMPPKGFRDLIVDPSIIPLLAKSNPNLINLLEQKDPAILEAIKNSPDLELKKYLQKTGSPGLTNYLTQGHTKIICCGHLHESIGVDIIKYKENPIVVFNGGTLKNGHFGEIYINDETKELDKILLYKIKGKLFLPSDLKENLDIDNVSLLMEYFLTKDGELKKLKIDLNDEHDY